MTDESNLMVDNLHYACFHWCTIYKDEFGRGDLFVSWMCKEKWPMIYEIGDMVIPLYCEEIGDESYVSPGEITNMHQRFSSHVPEILKVMVRDSWSSADPNLNLVLKWLFGEVRSYCMFELLYLCGWLLWLVLMWLVWVESFGCCSVKRTSIGWLLC